MGFIPAPLVRMTWGDILNPEEMKDPACFIVCRVLKGLNFEAKKDIIFSVTFCENTYIKGENYVKIWIENDTFDTFLCYRCFRIGGNDHPNDTVSGRGCCLLFILGTCTDLCTCSNTGRYLLYSCRTGYAYASYRRSDAAVDASSAGWLSPGRLPPGRLSPGWLSPATGKLSVSRNRKYTGTGYPIGRDTRFFDYFIWIPPFFCCIFLLFMLVLCW